MSRRWAFRRIPLYPARHLLYRLETPWGFVELHLVPYAR